MKIRFPSLVGYLAQLGITKQDLAKIIGCSKGTISNKLNGITEFRLAEAEIIYRTVNRLLETHGRKQISFEELFLD